jgi:hypothetical protein
MQRNLLISGKGRRGGGFEILRSMPWRKDRADMIITYWVTRGKEIFFSLAVIVVYVTLSCTRTCNLCL